MIVIHSLIAVAIVAVMAFTSAASAQAPTSPEDLEVAQVAVTQCAQAHPQAERTIELANKRLELARQSNGAAAMRTAIDDLQAALRQLRTDIAPCAGVQGGAPAAEHAGHVVPNTAQAPASAPGTPLVAPGSTAPPPAAVNPGAAVPAGTDPHAGHVMPGAPQTSAAAAPRAASPQARPTAPRSPSPAAATPGVTDAHAGHVMPASPQPPGAADTRAGYAMTTPENPAARLGDLTCQPRVDPDTAPRATYMGKAYYFCTAADRDLFLKAPAKYLQR